MNVTIATFDDSPPEGGQGVYVRDLRAALDARGVSVRTVSGRGDHAIAYPRLTRRPPLDLSLALSRDPTPLLTDRPDVVHAQGGPGGLLLLRALPVPLVYTAHHTYRQAFSLRSAKRALAPLERRAYARAASVIAVSPSTAETVRQMGIERVEVVPPGVDVDRLGAAGDSQRDADLLLFVGRMEREKGAMDALATMLMVTSQRPGTRGVMVGRGRLSAMVARNAARAPDAITVRGSVSDEELRSLYARAALVLMPSRYEGLGLVALEALAAGAPVVGYDVTGLRDAAREGGLLVPSGDTQALHDAALGLLDDPPRRAELAARGRERVAREYSWAVAAARVEEVYRTAVAAS
jgi:glycosyltransferase involved in cell wall biosynthesis